jgi:hypothetical protein
MNKQIYALGLALACATMVYASEAPTETKRNRAMDEIINGLFNGNDQGMSVTVCATMLAGKASLSGSPEIKYYKKGLDRDGSHIYTEVPMDQATHVITGSADGKNVLKRLNH